MSTVLAASSSAAPAAAATPSSTSSPTPTPTSVPATSASISSTPAATGPSVTASASPTATAKAAAVDSKTTVAMAVAVAPPAIPLVNRKTVSTKTLLETEPVSLNTKVPEHVDVEPLVPVEESQHKADEDINIPTIKVSSIKSLSPHADSFLPSEHQRHIADDEVASEEDSLSTETTQNGNTKPKRARKIVTRTLPRPPGGYKYSIDFLYNMGRDLVGVTIDIPTPISITPCTLRTSPPSPPSHLPLLTNAPIINGAISPTVRSGASSPNSRFAGTAGGSGIPPQFVYPGYMPSGPQRRLWHTENAVWQFDSNYPYNQGYTSQFGVPMMPMGFDNSYNHRFPYPSYCNQPGGSMFSPNMPHNSPQIRTSSRSSSSSATATQNETQLAGIEQSQPQESSPNGVQNEGSNGHQNSQPNHSVAPPWSYGRPGGQRERYGAGRVPTTATNPSFHRESKTFYNSSSNNSAVDRYKQYDLHSTHSRSQQQSTVTPNCSNSNGVNSGSNTNGSLEQNNGHGRTFNRSYKGSQKLRGNDRPNFRRGKNQVGNERTSNSSGSLSNSSSKSQFDRGSRPSNGGSSTISITPNQPRNSSPFRHPHRSYRNRMRYNGTNSGGEMDAPATSTMRKPANGENSYQPPREIPKYVDLRGGLQRQNTRFYQSRNIENFNYCQQHHHFMAYHGHMNENEMSMAEASSMGMKASDGEEYALRCSAEAMNISSQEDNANQLPELDLHIYKHGNHEMDICFGMPHDSAMCGNYDDGQSYASLAPSSASDISDSELSDASVESVVREVTMSCLALATGATVPDLDGPNLVPYGDMDNLKELARMEQFSAKNGYKLNLHSESCCGDMLALSIPALDYLTNESGGGELALVPVVSDSSVKALEESSVKHREKKPDEHTSESSSVSISVSPCSSKGAIAAAIRANIILDDLHNDELPLKMHNKYWHEFFGYTPADRFLLRSNLIEMKRPPRIVPSRARWDFLTLAIWKTFLEVQQSRAVYKIKMRLWRYIYTVAMAAYPRYGLYLVGSSISYFGSRCSDMDICMLACTNPNIDPRMEAVYHLQLMQDLLKSTDVFQDFNLIEARVPILRFTDRRCKVEIDINFNNSVGIRNTHLLYCYSQMEWRVRPIALTVKHWAQYHNINNAKNMTISSYSLMLMVIHFLQAGVSPPVLPCLHKLYPEKFGFMQPCDFGYVDMNEVIGPYQSNNSLTLGELMISFLHYYSIFDYSKYAISIRVGGVLPIDVCRISKAHRNDIHQWNQLCIEEPFDQTNTARSVYDPEIFDRVRAIFQASYRRLESTRNLNSIFEGYEGPTIAKQLLSGESENDLDPKVDSKTSSTSSSKLPSPKEQTKLMVDKMVVALWNDVSKNNHNEQQQLDYFAERADLHCDDTNDPILAASTQNNYKTFTATTSITPTEQPSETQTDTTSTAPNPSKTSHNHNDNKH